MTNEDFSTQPIVDSKPTGKTDIEISAVSEQQEVDPGLNLGLTKDDILVFLTTQSDTFEPPPLTDAEQQRKDIYIDLMVGYLEQRGVTPEVSRTSIVNRLRKERNFLIGLQRIFENRQSTDPVERRIIGAESEALYVLLTSSHVKSNTVDQDQQATTILQVLQQRRSNHEEWIMAAIDAPSIGLEAEFIDDIYLATEGFAGTVHELSAYHKSLVKKLGSHPLWQRHSQGSTYLPMVAYEHYPVLTAIQGTKFADFEPFEYTVDTKGQSEVAFKPVASAKLLSQEIRDLRASHTMEGDWGIHLTGSGIILDKSNTQIMDATAIAEGAGLFLTGTFSDKDAEGIKKGRYSTIEQECKVSIVNGEGVYFPFHRVRDANEVKAYPKHKRNAVEIRSLADSTKDEIEKLEQLTQFEQNVFWGIRAVQKHPNERSTYDIQMANAWDTLIKGWNDLLSIADIKNPGNNPGDRYWPVLDPKMKDTSKLAGHTLYEQFIPRVALASQRNPIFRPTVLKLIDEFNSHIDIIVEDIKNQEKSRIKLQKT